MPLPSRRDIGSADVVAGLAGGLFAPVAGLAGGLPLWASIPGAIAVFVGLRLALAPARPAEGPDTAALDEEALAFAAEVTDAAREDLARLSRASKALRGAEARDRLVRLHGIAAAVIEDVARRPSRLDGVRRLLTYYLPAAARLGEGIVVLEKAHRPDAARMTAATAMVERLDDVFAHHADRISVAEVDGLDVELRLLDETIRSEGGARTGQTPSRGTGTG